MRFDGKHTRDSAWQKLFFDWTDCHAVSGRLIPRKSSQQFGKKFHGMQHGTARCALQLLDAGDAAGKQGVRAHGALGGLPLFHKLFGHGLADIVEIFFVPEASGHPAAFHLRTGDFKAEPPQKFDRDGRVADGALLAMCVAEDPGTRRELANVKNRPRINSLLRKMPCEGLHQI